MDEKKRAQLLAKGEIDERIKRFGIFQLLTFKIERKKTVLGEVPYMKTDRVVEMSELVRISEEFGLPIDSLSGRIFPRGKMEKDFVGL